MFDVGQGNSNGNTIPQRKADGNIQVPLLPLADVDASSKKYVNDQIYNGLVEQITYFDITGLTFDFLDPAYMPPFDYKGIYLFQVKTNGGSANFTNAPYVPNTAAYIVERRITRGASATDFMVIDICYYGDEIRVKRYTYLSGTWNYGSWTQLIRQIDIIDNLTTDNATKVLSAKQGKALNDGKLDKLTGVTSNHQAYVKSSAGAQIMVDVTSATNPSVLLLRDGNGLIKIKRGTTAERPSTGLNAGDLYFNTEINSLEIYNGSSWYRPVNRIESTGTGTRAYVYNNDGSQGSLYVSNQINVFSNEIVRRNSNALLLILSGNLAARPTSGLINGMQYFNTDTKQIETYTDNTNHWLNQVYENGDTLPTPAVGKSHTYQLIGNGTAFVSGITPTLAIDSYVVNSNILTVSNVGGTLYLFSVNGTLDDAVANLTISSTYFALKRVA